MQWKEAPPSEKAPSGNHIARCVSIIDLGTQHHNGFNGGEPWTSRDVRIGFELPMEKMLGTYNEKFAGKPFGVNVTCKQSLFATAKLRKYIEGWRGKKLTKEETAAFDCKKLLGVACRLSLIENGDFTNIDGISPLSKVAGKAEVCPKAINPLVYFDLEHFDQAVFDKLGKATQEKIAKSPEYAALTSGGGEAGAEPPGDPSDEPPQNDDEPF